MGSWVKGAGKGEEDEQENTPSGVVGKGEVIPGMASSKMGRSVENNIKSKKYSSSPKDRDKR